VARELGYGSVVITGASSGIGRAAALAFARLGCPVVLAARDAHSLEEVARDCRNAGGRTLVVPTDMTDPSAVLALAQRAAEFGDGRIAVWVNNAGVAAFGLFLDVPVEAHEQVIRTNLLGYLYGAHAVLPLFKRQGTGVLINVVSMAAFAPTPLASSYSASKAGNRGLFETLRTELAGSGQDIHVCDLYPAFVDTPMLEHTANFEGKQINPVPPVIAVEKVANKIVSIARRPRAFTAMGAAFPVTTLFHAALPALFRWSVGKSARTYLALAPEVPGTEAGLHQASPGSHDTKGGLRSPRARTIGAGLAAGAGIVGAALLLRRQQRS
jgi:short-subunit dehydrogenase